MRKLLLNPTPLFRKLRQLSLLLTLLLALPQTAWGKRYTTTGDVTDATGNDAGTMFTWFTDATQTAEWMWVIKCENGTVTPDISTLTFTLPAGKNITMSFGGSTNNTSPDYTKLRKFTFDGLSNELTVSAALSQESTTYDFTGTNGVFTPSGNTNSIDMNGVLNITITNNSANSVTCTINSITVLTGQIISSDGLVWPENAEDPSTGSAISGITKSVSNNATTLSGNLNVDDIFSFPLKRVFGNQNIVELNKGDNLNYDIAYSSSNTNVAEVSGGDVTIKGYGSTTITATLTENDYYSYKQSTYSYTLTNTESYGLTIAGTAVTSANASAITGTGISGTVSFDANNKILTLNGATIDGTIESSLAILSIHLTGTNSISGNTTALLNGIKSTNGGTLTFTADASSTLHITTTGDAASAITDFADVTMGTGAYLQTDTPTKYDTNGKNFCWQVSSANIVKELNITSTPCYPLWIGNTQFTSTSTPTGFTFDATNNILTLTNVTQANPLISGLANLTIALSGDNSITKSDSSAVIRSINSQAALIIQKAGTGDGSLYLENNGSDPSASPVVKNFASINHTGLNYSSRSGSSINGASTHDAILSSATIYPLWIAGIPVTASTTSGTGWSYDAANNKLTLTNYNKTDNEGHAFISNMANLNVYLVGTNSVGPNSQTSTDKAFYTTYTNATLTFSTDENNKGTLSAGYNTFCEGFRTVNGIYCNNGLGYYPSSGEIKAKATPTIKFEKRDQTSGAGLSEYVGASETLQTAVNSAFKAPRPEFSNGYALGGDSTRYTYSYAPEGIVEIPLTATDPSTGNNTFGEMNILKAGTVTITCTYPGNLQNEACSASYTLQVDKGNAGIYFYTIENGNEEVVDNTTPAFSATYGQAFTGPAFKNPNNLTGLTWSSSPTSVAEVDNSGNVTIKFPGEATVTVTFAGNDNYNSASATYAIEVKPSAPTLSLESGVYYTNQQITATPTVTGTDLNTSLEINDGTNTSYVSISPYTYTFSSVGKFTASATTNFDLGTNLGVIASETTTATIIINNEPTFMASVGGNAYNETNPQAGNVIVQLSVTDLQDHCTLLYYLDSDASNPQPFNVQQPITLNETTTVNAFIRYTDNSVTPNIVYDSAPTSKTYTVKQNLGITDFEPDQNYQTCYLDNGFSLNKPQGLKVYIVTGISGNSVTTTAIDYIPQGVAVLLEKDGAAPAGGYVADTYTGTAGNFAGNLLKYTGGNTSVNTTGKEYILYKNEFVKATGEISAGRCYLDLSGTNLPARGVLGIGNDGSTAIEGIDVEATEDETWYDLQGRSIQKPTKAGIYIVNGKKMIINNK